MKLSKIFLIAVFSGIAFISCKNERGIDDDSIEMDRAATGEEVDLDEFEDDYEVSTRIRENRNLSTFSEYMDRNQVTDGWTESNRQGTTTGTMSNRTSTTGQNQTASGQNQTTDQSTGGVDMMVAYTIFAPANKAYESLPEDQRNEMMNTQNREKNVASINYLIVEQKLTQALLRQQIKDANGSFTIKTLQGENITASLDGNTIILKDAAGNQAKIIETDEGASDGVVHVIDKVLLPGDLSKNEFLNRGKE
jgi:uncharacterized surface protein with fasciclin (FAS1) repeats